ncbi:MAG: AmmeMemoRadiSam system radical SAM enzyme [Solirubrobacterales bacterium]
MRKNVPFAEKDGKNARCWICPHNCRIKPGGHGVCGVRINDGGQLIATNYGEVSSAAMDPIEKKPLYHFFPGRSILSIGTIGCNFSCGFCQNWNISRGEAETQYVSPDRLLELANEYMRQGSIGVAYTYSEPLMWYEYVADCAPRLADQGLRNVLVTNGYINPEPLARILPDIHAVNIDLKAFTEAFYHKHCRARLDPVKQVIEMCTEHIHVELTTLVIPGENDEPEEIDELARWVASVNSEIPLHLSRYHPAYEFEMPPTPLTTLQQAREAAQVHLKYVYVGNAGGFDNNTYCSGCGEVLVERLGYHTRKVHFSGGVCDVCERPAAIVE